MPMTFISLLVNFGTFVAFGEVPHLTYAIEDYLQASYCYPSRDTSSVMTSFLLFLVSSQFPGYFLLSIVQGQGEALIIFEQRPKYKG